MTTVPLTKYTRWRLSVPGGSTGTWDATFRIRGAGGRSSYMAPTQLAGCVGWFRADLGITLTGSNVSVWADQSGKGNDATAPAGREPGYNVAGHQINGQPTLYFDPTGAAGTEKMLEMVPGSLSLSTVHAFVVHRRATATETVVSRSGFWHIGQGSGERMPSAADGKVWDDFMASMTYDCGLPVMPLNVPNVYEVQATGTSWSSFLNGKAQGFSATNAPLAYNPPQLGGNTLVVPNNFYYGDWAEVVFYNRILTAGESALLVGYFNGRYGLGAK